MCVCVCVRVCVCVCVCVCVRACKLQHNLLVCSVCTRSVRRPQDMARHKCDSARNRLAAAWNVCWILTYQVFEDRRDASTLDL